MNPTHLVLVVNASLTEKQSAVITAPARGSLLVTGKAGTGKSTAAVLRMRTMMENGIDGDSILVLVPQRRLAFEYYKAIHSPDFPAGSQPQLLTFNGLAQRMLSLFWPLIATDAGFRAAEPPRFLNMENAQYYLAGIVEPLLLQGYFESLTIDPNRLYSQILDNLNKSAVVGFPPGEIAERLTSAWSGKTSKSNIYQQAQECALKFRQFCLENNFLDFSLQLSVFREKLWPSLLCRQHLNQTFRHLIYDNIEEDFPVAHDFVEEILPNLDSALLIQDEGGGYRSFLGADATSAQRLSGKCSSQIRLTSSLVQTNALANLETALRESILEHRLLKYDSSDARSSYTIHSFRFYPEALDWVTGEIVKLLKDSTTQPGDIAILTPYLSDALRFSFANRLSSANIPFTTYRPSRSLYAEPAVQAVLTLAQMAHPSWQSKPSPQQARSAFAMVIAACDFVRADLISRTLFKNRDNLFPLLSFQGLNLEMQSRISFQVGEYYERLRAWLNENLEQGAHELDHWISRLFGECLSQPGFGFHRDYDAASSINRLIESCREFRKIYQPSAKTAASGAGEEFTRVLQNGLLSSQSNPRSLFETNTDVVFLSPAYSFLMRNQPVKYQFWVDIGSGGWWSRLDQPLTQPYVLNRNWSINQKWTDEHEYLNNQLTLARVVTGLVRRCSAHIYMCSVTYNEHGFEERGQLLLALQTVLRANASIKGSADV
ncbi:MAG TPA: hypothetical protein P5282_06665 [Anaerolineaceae bacterium]|nr:hypothetical protein [Anaerolineaceae bacterium]